MGSSASLPFRRSGADPAKQVRHRRLAQGEMGFLEYLAASMADREIRLKAQQVAPARLSGRLRDQHLAAGARQRVQKFAANPR